MNFQRYLQNSRYLQYAAALIVTLSVPSGSIYIAWSSPALPKLQSEDSPIGRPITTEEGSWIASIPFLGMIPGGLIVIFIADRLPRKIFLLLSGISLFVPWLLCAFVRSATAIIISRFIGGIGFGISQICVPIYIGETAEKDIRGKLGALFSLFRLTGSLLVLSIGPFVSYSAITLFCSAFPVIFCGLFVFMPESPYYLVKTNKHDAAEKVLVKLSADQKSVKDNLEEIVKTVDFDKNKSSCTEILLDRQLRKPLMIMLAVKTFQQFSGVSAIDAYTQTIITSTGSSISPEVSSIICGFVQIPAGLVPVFLVDRVGRKPLWIISSLGCALALAVEGVYFYLQDELHQNLENISWVPTTALMVYLLMNPIGLFTVPYILVGELFATNIKDVAVSISILYGGTLAFIVTKYFKPLSELWGMHTMFWIFAGICISGAVTVYFALPETKGKTFLEIQKKINKI